MFTLISFSVLRSAILSQALWYNKSIKIDSKSINLSEISEKRLYCVEYLFNEGLSVYEYLKSCQGCDYY